MRKRLLAVLLCVCMAAACLPTAFAAGAVRETDFLTDQYHADVDFGDMDYVPVTREEFDAAVAAVKTLLAAEAPNETEVEAAFNTVTDLFQTVNTNNTLLNIRMSVDVNDDESLALYYESAALYRDIYDPFIYLIQDVLKSSCGKFLRDQLSEDDIRYYMGYGGQTDEQKKLAGELDTIEDAYWEAYYADYTYTYGGVAWTDAEAEEAYTAGELSEAAYTEISRAIAKDRNAAMGAVFMHALDLNTQIAATYGYDNYAEFSYAEEYGRDYTAEDVYAFADAVKEYIVPLSDEVYALLRYGLNAMDDETYYTYLTTDYTSDEMLSAIRPHIGEMSSELLEAWDYMIDHDLYDITYRDTKEDSGFTIRISGYGAPFFFNMPYGDPADFSTIIHEFGHYDNYYWHPSGWNDGSSTVDVAEVHSQALELLFTRYYADILGDAAVVAQDYLMYNMLYSAVVTGAMLGELELYAASTPNVTLQQINEKYRELAGEYGVVPEDDPRTEMYGWIETHHLTTSPMYYISYATSAAGAFTFWLEAQEEGYDAAVDHYLKFVSQSVYSPFLEQFETAGMDDPLSPAYVEELAGELNEALDVENRLTILQWDSLFEDVDHTDWFSDPVWFAYQYGLVTGVNETEYDPYGDATRAMAATIMWRLEGEQEAGSSAFPDLKAGAWYEDAVNWAAENGVVSGYGDGTFRPDRTITREEMAVIVYNVYHLEVNGQEPAALSFIDAEQVSPWAEEAMEWCAANGIFAGDDSGMLFPKKTLNRAELAQVLYNLCEVIIGDASASGAEPEPAAVSAESRPARAPLILR